MSDHSLPDEIVSEILSPALKVSDEVFSDASMVSPFASYSESPSAYLLVCKSWLRVATPLLYNVVILRSKAQAKALGLALSGNKQLGQFIKKLRVEGGYGPPMHIILRSSPNITDLFISFEIYSSDSTGGLCKGLPLINPTRLILRDFGYRRLENKMLTQLIDAIVESMSKWDRLCVFDCPYLDGSDRSALFIPPLVKFKRLHTLIIPQAVGLSWAYSTFKKCPLQVIRIKQPIWDWEKPCIPRADPVLMALLQFSERPPLGKNNTQDPISEPLIAPSLNLSFIPLAGASEEVCDAIWARVLYFAMSVPELANGVNHKYISPRLPLLLVSKTFNRLGLPHYYTYTALKKSSAMSQFAWILSKNPSIGPCVRGIGPPYVGWDDELDSDESNSDIGDGVSKGDSMLTILSQTSGLVRLGASTSLGGDPYRPQVENMISWVAFEAMAHCSGSTLRELSVQIKTSKKTVSATIFKDLAALRTLDWDCETGFISTSSPFDGLPSLEELCISSASDSFFTALSLMKLESLRHVVLLTDTAAPEKFLEAHGHKLIELKLPCTKLKTLNVEMFQVCPNLTSISLSIGYDTSPRADSFDSSQMVTSLLKIILDRPFWTRDKNLITAWDQFFMNFEPARFPNLREIQVKCCVWPTSERDIAKSCWVRWAEILLKRNISLTDKAGKKWRPRLKVK
ncbi:hypothetical protein B0H19DRAFT_1139424 [Mycena capillaripes]|nr:hypothetical protein B0H19DRAFT_1139424 [Mycena capillaripes]